MFSAPSPSPTISPAPTSVPNPEPTPQPSPVPTAEPSPLPSQALGCANGQNAVPFTTDKVVGCDGEWSTPGISNGEALCNTIQGWHLCATGAEAQSLGLNDCVSDTVAGTLPSNTFYATAESSNGDGKCTNDGAVNTGKNDLWGCGNGINTGLLPAVQGNACGPLNKRLDSSINYDPSWNFGNDGFNEAKNVYKTMGSGGVLCCR